MQTFPRLYPILDIETLDRRGIDLRAAALAMASGGVSLVQLRDKRSPPQQVLAHAAVMTEAFQGTGCRLVMNDRVDLAILAGWGAVHLGHTDLPPEAARRLSPAKPFFLGVSTHSAEQVLAAQAGTANYVAIGPVFATSTKADTEPVVGLEGVRAARRLTTKPLVAIGGITRANAAEVLAAGADSVAVIGALLSADGNVEQNVRAFQDYLR